ncbi:MAG TPA: hypothetical protein VFM88_17130 [Vicinamibacteria bacterium]|nr:hypothetical protein [Vicinamibacteria bacterium]
MEPTQQVAGTAPRRARLLMAMAVAILVRLPFWIEAWRAPADADTAIVGLMALHPFSSTTFWGQPYGSPLESWLVAPAVALGAGVAAIRLAYFALSLSLVPLAWALAARIDPRAALPAALVVACPPAYLLLMASLPPPLYPATLALCGLLLLLALELRSRAESGLPTTALGAAWGALAGLALWTHLMSASAVVAGAIALAPLARRSRAALLAPAAGLLVASAPMWVRAVLDGQVFTIVRLSSPRVSWSEHFFALLPQLHLPLGALLGAGAPVVPDLERRLDAPPWLAIPSVLLWIGMAARGATIGRRSAAGRLALAAAALTVVFFPIPLRSHAHTVRFLTPLYVPLAAVVGAAAAARGPAARYALAGMLAVHAAGAGQLLGAWRAADRTRAPYNTPDLGPARRLLEEHGIGHAFASYETAYRITFESREALVVSQPWNERFPRLSLPYLERVRSARPVAWVLTPGVPSDLPTPESFEESLRRAGGSWRRERAGAAVVFYDFEPPSAEVGREGSSVSWFNGHPELRPARRARAPEP